MNEKIQAFLTVIAKQKRYSEHTVEAYRRDIEEFQAYLEKEAIGDFDEVDYTMLRGNFMTVRWNHPRSLASFPACAASMITFWRRS